MQWSLVLLILMGQCSLFTCQLYEYHFINKNKTWSEAQKYCRKEYTDLASVYRKTDIDKLRQCDKKQDKEAWIGLYNETVTNKTEWKWRWSQAEVNYTEDQANWKDGDPNNNAGSECCVVMKGSTKSWSDTSCTLEQRPFICYNATTTSDTFYVIEEEMTWLEARKYCRENHTDLVSGKKQLEDQQLTSKLQNKDYWIGLFRVTWRWSDGRSSFIKPWNQIFSDNQPDNKCAMLDKEGSWNTDDCDSTKPFFCYNDKVILIKKNKTWEEAINHCRENYKDLISITDAEQQSWVQEIAKNASSSHVWLALRFTCILEVWFWVTDERVDYKNWASDVKMDDCNMSGAMETGGDHKWVKEDDMTKFNFFCSKF